MRYTLFALLICAAAAACAKGGDEAPAAEPPATAVKKAGKPVGRGVIADPRKAGKYLDKARTSADKMSGSSQQVDGELDKIK